MSILAIFCILACISSSSPRRLNMPRSMKSSRPLRNASAQSSTQYCAPQRATGKGLQRKANSESLDVRASHPKFLIERWERQFGTDAAEALCHWNNRPPPIYARINQLKINRQTFLERYSQRENAAECFGFCRTPVTRRRARSGRFLCSGPKHIARLRIVAGEAGRKDSGRLRSSRWQDWAHR
jgi:hypothetical protein